MPKKFTALICFLVVGCATTGEISKVGKDTYMVGTSDISGFESKSRMTQVTLAKANAHCANMGKVMMLSHSQNTGTRGFTPLESEIVFRCVDESSPDYQSVNMRKEADTVIQIQK